MKAIIPSGQVGSACDSLDRKREYPFVWIHESRDYAELDLGEPIMEFRLTYQGPLYADRGLDDKRQSRLIHQHQIRKHFHAQLAELWRLDSRLKRFTEKNIHIADPNGVTSHSRLEEFVKLHESNGIKWVPLVTDHWGVACGLDILFLRHEPKGGIIQSGDLDNRITTLFDAMRIPKPNQMPDDVVLQNEPDPFFCLLSDDKLIAEFRVTSDRLLVPSQKPQGDAEVHLVVGVRTFVTDRDKAYLSLGRNMHE